MAIFTRDSECNACGQPLGSEELVGFPAFIPRGHRLARYSDAVFHKRCFEELPEHTEVLDLLRRRDEIWATRPKDARTIAEMDAWAREAFKDFPPP